MKKKVILSLLVYLGIVIIMSVSNSVEIRNDLFQRTIFQQRNMSILSAAEVENDELPSEWFNLELPQTDKLSLEVENRIDNPIKGDINKDGYITSKDALEVLRYASGITGGIDNTGNRLDIDGDGRVTAIDARKILQLDKAIYTSDMNNSLISNSLVSNFGESIYSCNRLNILETLVIIPNKYNNSMKLEVESSNPKIASVEFIEGSDRIKVTPKSMGFVRIRVREKDDLNVAAYITLSITEDMMIKAEDNAIINPQKGDINKDGLITKYDAKKALQYVSGITGEIDNTGNRLDINGDGKVNTIDARKVLQLTSYIENPIEENLGNLTEYFGEGIEENYNKIYVGDVLNLECISEKRQKIDEGVVWNSTDTNVVRVENGVITAVGEGKATIIAVTKDHYSSSVTILVKEYIEDSSEIMIKSEDNVVTDPQKGDINKDGIITRYDAEKALQYVSGITGGIDNTGNRLDINEDGKVNTVDARKVLQLTSYIENPIEENLGNLTEYFGEGIENNYNKIYVGDSLNLECINREGQKMDDGVDWASTDTNVVTVENGVITAKGRGRAKITATVTKDNNKYLSSVSFVVGETILSSIEIKTSPDKTNYIVGEKLDTTGLTILLRYDNGTTKEITNGFTCTPTILNKEGEQKVTVSYEGKEVIFNVTVIPVLLENIEIIIPPKRIKYIAGQNFDKEGLSIIKIYNNKSECEITDYSITNGEDLKIGQKSVTISYTENGITKTAEQPITVERKTVTSIVVKEESVKKDYYIGDTLKTEGIVLIVTYNDGTTQEIREGFTCTPTELSEVGTKEITISYEEKTVTFDVEVKNIELEDIEITKQPSKTSYVEGQTFDKTGMVVTATYNDGTSKEVTNYTVTDGNNLTAGKTSVTISYTENGVTKTAEHTIKVVQKGDANGDGKVDFMDILAINKHRLGKAQLEGIYLEAADVNGDNKVDFMDILQINKYRLGKIDSL